MFHTNTTDWVNTLSCYDLHGPNEGDEKMRDLLAPKEVKKC